MALEPPLHHSRANLKKETSLSGRLEAAEDAAYRHEIGVGWIGVELRRRKFAESSRKTLSQLDAGTGPDICLVTITFCSVALASRRWFLSNEGYCNGWILIWNAPRSNTDVPYQRRIVQI